MQVAPELNPFTGFMVTVRILLVLPSVKAIVLDERLKVKLA